MMPYEAIYGRKPDLRGVRECGETVWVWVEGGSKLGGRMREGRWMGFNDRSVNGMWVYYPDNRTVRVEQNIWFDKTQASRQHLEGDNWELVVDTDVPPRADVPVPPPTPHVVATPARNMPAPVPAPIPAAEPPVLVVLPEPELPAKCVRKPSAHVQDLLCGVGSTSNCPSDPIVARGVRVPGPVEFEGEGEADWMMATDWAEEYAIAAEMRVAEALELRSLADARHRPDWPLWETAIREELTVLAAQGTWELVDPLADANIVGSISKS
ncbi:hypothetical protein K438DRAFT_1593537 [Mycena galopus ATCC 62051]|nr:hypothetical protein K438DRAFT_1593537 [Mycena galopus ATCC 62051]